MVSSEPMTSINAASTPARLSATAVAGPIMPVWTNTIRLNSRLIFVMVGMNGSRGTEPFGVHPPLIRQPEVPCRLSFVASVKSISGVVAGYMVFRTFPSQCLQLSAHDVPVTDMVGKCVCKELQ